MSTTGGAEPAPSDVVVQRCQLVEGDLVAGNGRNVKREFEFRKGLRNRRRSTDPAPSASAAWGVAAARARHIASCASARDTGRRPRVVSGRSVDRT